MLITNSYCADRMLLKAPEKSKKYYLVISILYQMVEVFGTSWCIDILIYMLGLKLK